jgi:cephalosporin hydroxylase
MTLQDLYTEQCATPSDIYLHLPRFVQMVTELNAQHVIELGTRTGVSTIAWLYSLEQTGGRLTSVDIDEKPAIGEFDHWTFIQGSDLDPDVISQLDEADIVFIDTSHLYEHTVQELAMYRFLVKPGGLIVLHDTMLEHPEGAPLRPRFPVRLAVEEFVAENQFEYMNIPECWGLGIVKVG